MATLTVESVVRAGLNPTFNTAASGGDNFTNDGATWLHIKNAHATVSRTVTLDIKSTVDGQAVTDPTVVVPALGDRVIGPFPTTFYNDANGRVNITYSSEADLTVAVCKLT